MISWLIALAAGAAGALAAYAQVRATGRWATGALRAISVTSLVALALNAVVGARRVPAPLVALDVSSSWDGGVMPRRSTQRREAPVKQAATRSSF